MSVTVKSAFGEDLFILEPQSPYRLREWKKSDGGSLKLRKSLKLDYWNYNKTGDLERAFIEMNPAMNDANKSGFHRE